MFNESEIQDAEQEIRQEADLGINIISCSSGCSPKTEYLDTGDLAVWCEDSLGIKCIEGIVTSIVEKNE